MNQEIWRWHRGTTTTALCQGTRSFLKCCASICSDGEFGKTWMTWISPNVGGVPLTNVMGSCKTEDDAILAASKEVQRQLKSHGIECEIRRAKM